MAQPTDQKLLDTGHAFYGYFWYANGSGLWDARNGAMATKTGTGDVTATGEGGTNVANSAGTTYYSTGALTALGDPCTVGFKVKRTSASGDKGVVLGNRASADSFFWIRASEVRAFGLTTANSNPDSWATFHYVRLADGSGKLYKNGAFVANVPWAGTRPVDSIMDGYSGGTLALDGALEYMHVIPGLAASAGQVSSLYADPYQMLDVASGATITGNLGTATASGFVASIAAAVTISCALGGAIASGNQATISTGSNVTITASLGTAAASGYSASVVSSGSATITTDVFKNNTGTVLASTSIPKAVAIKLSDLTLAASWTSQTTNGSGVLSLTSAGMTTANDYLLVVSNADGSAVGVKKYTAV